MRLDSVKGAEDSRVVMIHQELNIVEDLSIRKTGRSLRFGPVYYRINPIFVAFVNESMVEVGGQHYLLKLCILFILE